VAAHLPADTLIVDEVLAVGDAAFQAKSLTFLETSWRASGRSVLYVAHQLGQVRRLCDRVIWLNQGLCELEGPADLVCDAYLENQRQIKVKWAEPTSRSGIGDIRASSICFEGKWVTGQTAILRVNWTSDLPTCPLDIRIRLERIDGNDVTVWSSLFSGSTLLSNRNEAILELPNLSLSSGTYIVHLRILKDGLLQDDVKNAGTIEVLYGKWQGLDYPMPRPMCLQTQKWY